jgi:putative membrane protein
MKPRCNYNSSFEEHGRVVKWGKDWERVVKRVALIGFLSGTPFLVQAHSGEFHREEWWKSWSWEPLILLNLGLAGWLYGAGVYKLWKKAGVGRGISRKQAAAFGGGLLALFMALISPLDGMSGELSSAHMVQHMMLMNVAAPLLVLGAPGLVCMWAFPLKWRNAFRRWTGMLESWRSPWYLLWQPLLMWGLYGFTLWVWHLPGFYQAALRNQWVHDFQHLTFLLTSCLFWRVLLDPISRYRLSRGVGVIYLFTTSLHATVLGVFMALAPGVWYPDYETTTAAWNLTALEDQQLAGLIMWMPACMIYALAAAGMFAIWLGENGDVEETAAQEVP